MADLAHPSEVAVVRRDPERRLTSRFQIHQEVHYRLLQSRAASASGTGKTLNVSSRGILFTTTGRLPPGRMVEVAMHWPARLHGTCPLQFIAFGRVIRSDGKTAAVRIQRYEFRTRSATAAGRPE